MHLRRREASADVHSALPVNRFATPVGHFLECPRNRPATSTTGLGVDLGSQHWSLAQRIQKAFQFRGAPTGLEPR